MTKQGSEEAARAEHRAFRAKSFAGESKLR